MADAAAAPIDALTAEQGLTDELAVGAGDQVLITAGAGGVGHFAVQIARILGAEVVATASPQHHEFLHRLGAAVVIDHTRPDWPDQVREVTDGGARRILACAAPTLAGAARAARDGAVIATPVHAEVAGRPGGQHARWLRYDGQARGSRPDPAGPVVRRRFAVGHRAGPRTTGRTPRRRTAWWKRGHTGARSP